jgi:hypothetical protein
MLKGLEIGLKRGSDAKFCVKEVIPFAERDAG